MVGYGGAAQTVYMVVLALTVLTPATMLPSQLQYVYAVGRLGGRPVVFGGFTVVLDCSLV